MTESALKSDALNPGALRSGKGHRDENFPVASRLIHPRHRGAILAFYEFVRTADDMADHATLPAREKLALLDHLEGSLLGKDDEVPEGVALRTVLRERNLSARHAQDLLTAFRMDVTKLRYRDWDDLMNYCTYSAMPVGRFVLDVHGEDRSIWPANDALCAALQIINHLQDCRKDFRDLDRVYVPLDVLAASGATVSEIGAERSSPALRACLRSLAVRTGQLLDNSAPFSAGINDVRLALEVSVIQTLARRLTTMLKVRDPLSERVHLKAPGVAGLGLVGILAGAVGRIGRRFSASHNPRNA
jgi:hydroxysqualene synthase